MQGYIVLACDDNKYRDMALNLARSLRVFDPARKICLIYNDGIALTNECHKLFDDLINFRNDLHFVGVMNKAKLYDLSPYDKTMYVDADMLLMKPNIAAYWKVLDGNFFKMTGEKCVRGHWYGMDIEKVIEDFQIPYVVRMNSGVFYFEKSSRAENFFSRVIEIFVHHKEGLSAIHRSRPGQYADEPIFGVAMGEQLLDPLPSLEGEGSWMVTTWQSRRHVFDPANGVCFLQKSTGYPFRQQWLSREWVNHSPNFVHFIKLQPRRFYEEAVVWFESRIPLEKNEMDSAAVHFEQMKGGQ